MKFFFDRHLNSKKKFESLIALRMQKINSKNFLNKKHVYPPLDDEERELLRDLSFNFVALGDKLLEGGKQISFNSTCRQESGGQLYYAGEAGFASFSEENARLEVLPSLYVSTYFALVVVPMRVLAPAVLTKKDVGASLEKCGLKGGNSVPIYMDLLHNAIESGNGEVVVAAVGKLPVESSKEKVYLNSGDIHHLMHSTMECLSYEEINFFVHVKKGEVIGEYTQALEAESGRTLFGDEVKPKSYSSESCVGENLSKDSNARVVCTMNGCLTIGVGGVMRVRKLHIVEGSLKENFVSKDSDLDVLITENVENGLRLVAKGSVRVLGNVDASTIVSGGEIVVGGGVTKNAFLEAGASVEMQFAAKSTIISHQNIKVRKYILCCSVLCNGVVDLLDRKIGRVVGSFLVSGFGLTVPELGSENGLFTRVQLTKRSQKFIDDERSNWYLGTIAIIEKKMKSFELLLGKAYFENPTQFLKKIPSIRKERFLELLKVYNGLKIEKKMFEKMLATFTSKKRKEKDILVTKRDFLNTDVAVRVAKKVFSDTQIVMETCAVKITTQLRGNYKFYYNSESRKVVTVAESQY